MNDRIKNAFAQVQAGEELKDKTREFLADKTRGYTEQRRSVGFAAAAKRGRKTDKSLTSIPTKTGL